MRINAILTALIGLSLVLATTIGSSAISLSEWTAAWLGTGDPLLQVVIFEIRLPRSLAALSVGFALGLAGAALQGLLRNPLAEPGVLGVSASSSLFASLTIYYGWAVALPWLLPIGAVFGALVATAVLVWVGWRSRSITRLILVGVALSSLSAAVMSLLLNFSPNPFSMTELIYWLLGSVANKSYTDLLWVWPLIAIGTLMILGQGRALTQLSLGEEAAHSLGIPLTRVKLFIIVGTGLLAGASVALAGTIGFVGIVAPHLIRPWVGSRADKLLIPSGLLAGGILMWADSLVQVLPTQAELQLGVMAAIIGSPIFIALVVRMTHYE